MIQAMTIVLAQHGAFCKDQILQKAHFHLTKDWYLISYVEESYRP